MCWNPSHHVELRQTVAIMRKEERKCGQQPHSSNESKIHDCHVSNLWRTFTYSFEDPIFKEAQTLYLDAEYCETQGNFQPFKEAFMTTSWVHNPHHLSPDPTKDTTLARFSLKKNNTFLKKALLDIKQQTVPHQLSASSTWPLDCLAFEDQRAF